VARIAQGTDDARGALEALARALESAAPSPVELCSIETARTAGGGWVAFVGCRVGSEPLRHGVGMHDDPATAAADALISALNRFDWETEDRQAAA
jgi:2-isopropylmalate synthase